MMRESGKNGGRLCSVLLALLLVLSLMPAQTAFADSPADWEYVPADDGVKLSVYFGASSTIVTPTTLNGFPVTAIGNSLFYVNEFINEVVISDGVTSIGDDAFYECTALSSVSIPDSVTSIGSAAFFDCVSLENLNLPAGLKTIEPLTFFGCPIKTIDIPQGVTKIGKKAFSCCSFLMNVTIPDSVTEIGDDAFEGCCAMQEVTIPGSMKIIGSGAFYDCSHLTDIWFSGTRAQWDAVEKAKDWDEGMNDDYIVHYKANVTLNAEPAVGGNITCKGSGYTDDSVTVTAEPAEDYAFVSWTENGQKVSTQAEYSFTLTGDRVLTANFAPRIFPLWVGGVQVTRDNMNDILNDSTARYDPDSNTLKLNNAHIEGVDLGRSISYSGKKDLTVELTGSSICEGPIVIDADSNLIITGGGSLTASGDTEVISTDGDLTVDGCSISVTSARAYAIISLGGITITDSIVTAESGAGSAISSDGMLKVSGNSLLSAKASIAMIVRGGITMGKGVAITTPEDGRLSGIYIVNQKGETASAAVIEQIPTYTVTYKVENGTWSDGGTQDKTETVQKGSKPADIPTGMTASAGYTGGAWDTDPAGTVITGDTAFTYVFDAIPTYTVTYKVKNGTWSDGGTQDKTETVQSGSKPADIPTGMTASAGYTGGTWDTDPAGAEITGAKTFTYTFDAVPTFTVTYKVANGTWSDGGTENKTETVQSGAKPADIPSGMTASAGYTGGIWDKDPAETSIAGDMTFTYSFEAFDYIVSGGADGAWTADSGADFTLTVKRSVNDSECFAHFTGVELDGSPLNADGYTAKAGSTIVTLKAAALQKLSVGNHTVKILFDDGSAAAALTVREAPATPPTGDEGGLGMWIALTCLSCMGFFFMILQKQKKKVKN